MAKSRSSAFLQMTCLNDNISSQRLFDIESLLETVNTSACVNELLLACKERMAVRADFNTEVALCGTCYECIAASACDCCLLILGMDSLFHLYLTSHNRINIQVVL